MQVEVLIASLNNDVNQLINSLNIQTNAVIANQCDKEYSQFLVSSNGSSVKVINTSTRGVGINRNLAILHSTCEILLFGDDDVNYYDNYEKTIINEFQRYPLADVIIFEIDYRKSRAKKEGRILWFQALKYGTVRIAIRRNSLLIANVWFSLLFGGGATYSSGEDTIFIQDLFRKKLKVYKSNKAICAVNDGNSTWFNGYTDKFFEDKGVLLYTAFRRIYRILIIYYSIKYAKEYKVSSPLLIHKKMNEGIKRYKQSVRSKNE